MTNRVDSAVVCQDDTRQQATVNMTNITVNLANIDGQQDHHVHHGQYGHGQLVQLGQNVHMVLQGHHSQSVNRRIICHLALQSGDGDVLVMVTMVTMVDMVCRV